MQLHGPDDEAFLHAQGSDSQSWDGLRGWSNWGLLLAGWLAAGSACAFCSLASVLSLRASHSGIDLKWPLEADLRLKKCFSAPPNSHPAGEHARGGSHGPRGG
eukprot:COSAG01_NODE_1504_length_10094_cov_24.449925_13_plen_103_part_00